MTKDIFPLSKRSHIAENIFLTLLLLYIMEQGKPLPKHYPPIALDSFLPPSPHLLTKFCMVSRILRCAPKILKS